MPVRKNGLKSGLDSYWTAHNWDLFSGWPANLICASVISTVHCTLYKANILFYIYVNIVEFCFLSNTVKFRLGK
jgi:hypothetical protein